ncbi:MAG: putative DNA binding domain-containing protein [Paludibacter sp.]|nr:putative DNA binding domain-containing protein [Paludibacter sp.]
MEESICIIKEYITIEDKEYLRIVEKLTGFEHIIPTIQLFDNNLIINSENLFYKTYNSKLNKYFYIQKHPYYKLNNDYEFPIIRLDSYDNADGTISNFFIIEDIDNNEISIKAHKIQLNENWKKQSLICKVMGYRKNRLVLQNNDFYNENYEIDNEYEFKFLEFGTYEYNDRTFKSIIVEDLYKNKINVKALDWQTQKFWRFETLRCKVLKLNSSGIPHLLNIDFRHPIYEIGKSYKFEILDHKYKVDSNNSDKKYHVFELLGEDNNIYEANVLPGQIAKSSQNEVIECEVVSIKYKVRLKQNSVRDHYFIFIEDIVTNDALISKYFKKALNDLENHDSIELNEQYTTQSAFWVFTFCGKILPRYFSNHIERYDYKSGKEIASLIIIIEEWILSRGIISAFPNEKARKSAQTKANQQLENYKTIFKAVNIVSSVTFQDYFNFKPTQNLSDINLSEIYFILKFSNFKLIDESQFLIYFKSVLNLIDLNDDSIYFLSLIDKLISSKKHIFYDNSYENQFNLTAQKNKIFENEVYQEKYFNWSYCQLLIYIKLEIQQKANYIIGKILRQYNYVTDSWQIKKKLLLNAYYYQNTNSIIHLNIPLKFDRKLEIDFSNLFDNPNCCGNSEENWKLIINSYINRSVLKINVIRREFNGYVVEYKNIIGFLPFNQISDRNLKHYNYEQVDFTINCVCILSSEDFNFFVVKQLEITDIDYLSQNNKCGTAQVNEIIEGIIKGITEYGIFLSTPYGDGLLHIGNISTGIWNKSKIEKHFIIGKKLLVVITNTNNNKIDLSFIDLKNTMHADYYNDFIHTVENGNTLESELSFFLEEEENNYNTNPDEKNDESNQLEKAFCFEQYVVLQNDLSEKIHYLRLAKHFFSSVNHARSYLINIYTTYFEILLLIDETISEFEISKLQRIKAEAGSIIDKIESKTLENFPDAENLIFFLRVLKLFNDSTDESIEKLYQLANQYNKINEKNNLKTIAKIALSNNLIISESDEYIDFTKKNLKLLRSYIDNGVLTLKESESDRHERELNEKFNYWVGKIKENESETIEFKSTFKTPLPSEKQLKKKESLIKLLESTQKNENILKEIDKIDGELASKAVIHSSLKTLCAFANTNGGHLFIGVKDDQSFCSLNHDYLSLKGKKDRDGFGLFFDSKIKEYFEDSFSSLISSEFLKTEFGDILIVTVKQSIDPIFLLRDEKGNKTEELYVRELTSSKEIESKKELLKFAKQKQIEQLRNKLDVNE